MWLLLGIRQPFESCFNHKKVNYPMSNFFNSLLNNYNQALETIFSAFIFSAIVNILALMYYMISGLWF